MNCRVLLILFLLTIGLAATTQAITIQPDETGSKDTFGYQGIPGLPTGNFNAPPFNAFLPAGPTGTGHDTESVLEFDLSGVALTAAQVTSATLELFVVDTAATGFGISPTLADPATVNLFSLTGAWDESTVTWSSLPGTGSQYASTLVDGINTAVTFDVTTLVKEWLDGTLPNNGLLLRGDAIVSTTGGFVIPTFSASAGSVAPKLTIVPEPSSVVLALFACGAVACVFGRRAARRHGM
jgi:hypothetical protein